MSSAVRCDDRLELLALPGVPIVQPGDDVGALACDALARTGIRLESGRAVLVVTSKIVSRAEDRLVDVSRVDASARAHELAARIHKEPRIVELILRESSAISRVAPGVLIVRHRIGFISANAG